MALRRTNDGIFLGFEHVDMLFIRHSDEVKFVPRLNNWFQKDTDTWTLDFFLLLSAHAV